MLGVVGCQFFSPQNMDGYNIIRNHVESHTESGHKIYNGCKNDCFKFQEFSYIDFLILRDHNVLSSHSIAFRPPLITPMFNFDKEDN